MSSIIDLSETFYQSHITFTSIADVIQVTKPLNEIGLSYFTFDRTYKDGSHIRLTNAGQWIESYYRTELYKAAIFEKDIRLFANGYVFWSWLSREPIYSAAAEHNIDHGLTIIKKHDAYVSFFHFGTTRENFITPEQLITKMDFLYHFIAFFKQRMHKAIQQAEKDRFVLPTIEPEKIQLTNLKQRCCLNDLTELLKETQVTRIYLGDEFDNQYLTRQELYILSLLKQNLKPSHIAMQLNLSRRTLETHVRNLKRKFKCDTLFALGYHMGVLNLGHLYPFKVDC